MGAIPCYRIEGPFNPRGPIVILPRIPATGSQIAAPGIPIAPKTTQVISKLSVCPPNVGGPKILPKPVIIHEPITPASMSSLVVSSKSNVLSDAQETSASLLQSRTLTSSVIATTAVNKDSSLVTTSVISKDTDVLTTSLTAKDSGIITSPLTANESGYHEPSSNIDTGPITSSVAKEGKYYGPPSKRDPLSAVSSKEKLKSCLLSKVTAVKKSDRTRVQTTSIISSLASEGSSVNVSEIAAMSIAPVNSVQTASINTPTASTQLSETVSVSTQTVRERKKKDKLISPPISASSIESFNTGDDEIEQARLSAEIRQLNEHEKEIVQIVEELETAKERKVRTISETLSEKSDISDAVSDSKSDTSVARISQIKNEIDKGRKGTQEFNPEIISDAEGRPVLAKSLSVLDDVFDDHVTPSYSKLLPTQRQEPPEVKEPPKSNTAGLSFDLTRSMESREAAEALAELSTSAKENESNISEGTELNIPDISFSKSSDFSGSDVSFNFLQSMDSMNTRTDSSSSDNAMTAGGRSRDILLTTLLTPRTPKSGACGYGLGLDLEELLCQSNPQDL